MKYGDCDCSKIFFMGTMFLEGTLAYIDKSSTALNQESCVPRAIAKAMELGLVQTGSTTTTLLWTARRLFATVL